MQPSDYNEPGLYYGMADDVYHAIGAPDADGNVTHVASNSRLGQIDRSPAHCLWGIMHPDKETPAKKLGTAVHTSLLQPDKFDATYCVAEQCSAPKSKGAKERCPNMGKNFDGSDWYCGTHGKSVEHTDNRIVLPGDDFETCVRIRERVRNHPAARQMFEWATDTEVTAIARHEETGMLVKARFDIPLFEQGIIVDIKTAMDASPGEFQRSLGKFGYGTQAALYCWAAAQLGQSVEQFVQIVAEKDGSFEPAVYCVDQADQELCWQLVESRLRRFAECVKSGVWPGYGDRVKTIGLTDWDRRRIREQLESEGAM